MGQGFKHWIGSRAACMQTPALPACKPQLCHSPAIVTVLTENILKRDTCAPPFGYQTVVPKELEFPQESHAGSRKRLKSGVCKKANRFHTALTTCLTALREGLDPRQWWVTDGQDHPLDQDCLDTHTSYYLFKPEPPLSVP